MDRNSLIRTVLIFVGVLVLWKVVWPKLHGQENETPQREAIAAETYVDAPDFPPDPVVQKAAPPDAPPPAPIETCQIKGNRFDAELSTRGAALTHFWLHDKQYADSDSPQGFDMVSSNWDSPEWKNLERWRPLRTLFRAKDADDQVKYDRFNWKLQRQDDKGCVFTYADPDVAITKTIRAGDRPFELKVDTKVKNLADGPRKHQLSVEMFAFHLNKEMKSHLGRVSPFVTDLDCASGNKVTRKMGNDSLFKKGWFEQADADRFSAISNYYFAQAIIPENGAGECRLLAEDWYTEGQKPDADDAGIVFHANLVYPARTLEKGGEADYSQIAFLGPKERDVLKTAGGPGKNLGDLINLGFFSPVAKVLVGSLVWLKTNVTKNWGLAIVLLTVVLRLILFPLTWKSIKTTVNMRRLKPELDELNKKFAGDAQAKNLAMMELYKKRGVNPLGGCLPQVIQMPVWFAMYTTLQTAVEMYHTRFLWFHDLSAPDQLFGALHLPFVGALPAFGPLPFVLGALMVLQQKIVPTQIADPMQQKLMMYVMPGVFMVMMLFLPAALGVYMLTNSVLGISQQLLVEKFAPHDGGGGGGKASPAKGKAQKDDGSLKAAVLGKGKARV